MSLLSRSVPLVTAAVLLLLLFTQCVFAAKNITFAAYVYDMNSDHQDVERYGGNCECGAVMDILGPDRLPIWRGGWNTPVPPAPARGQYLFNQQCSTPCRSPSDTPPGGTGGTGHAPLQEYFEEWFNPIPGWNNKIPMGLVLTEISPPGTYRIDRQSSPFFPVSRMGWGADMATTDPTSYENFNFALAVHAEFVYNGSEVFSFSGDDDVWVFLNGVLIMDLGGLHPPVSGSVALSTVATRAGLVVGKRHTFDFFQVERHTTGSNCLITTTIVPTNQPPTNADATYSLNVGEVVSARFPSYDREGDVLTTRVYIVSGNPIAPLISFSPDYSTFTFTAPLTLGPVSTTTMYSLLFSVADAEFKSCNATVTFYVSQVVFPPPPPPAPVVVVIRPPAAKGGLSKTATIAIIAGASALVLIAIIAVVVLILYLRSQVAGWTAEIMAQIFKEGAQENPLYVPDSPEYVNPLHVSAAELARA
eukprot:c71_g1_i1.p1 GENE.c71_g1_i1~~c71_g1_i1.p1  ORF type:complete len:475 (-),score=79.14 c71_g1_i1:77-1501(-)